jgi:hypothetical protein
MDFWSAVMASIHPSSGNLSPLQRICRTDENFAKLTEEV